MTSIFRRLMAYGFGSQRNIPGLDGMRAVSILLVLFAHLRGTRNFPIASFQTPLGTFGVRVFFVISGYLITSILLRELATNGAVSLPRFYLRRTIRLFPASYFFVAAVALLSLTPFLQVSHAELLYAATYTMNFHRESSWPLGHLWSLAVEEQFYLLWPFALSLLGAARSLPVLLALLFIAPLARFASPYLGSAVGFLVWSDALATGCLLALYGNKLSANLQYRKLLASRAFILVPLVALAANYLPSTKLQWLVGDPLVDFAIAICVDWVIRNPNGVTGRFLNRPAVAFAGVLSYSLYLWQQIFLNRNSTSPLCAFPLNILLALVAALCSYLLVEAPLMRLRPALERRLLGEKQTALRQTSGSTTGA